MNFPNTVDQALESSRHLKKDSRSYTPTMSRMATETGIILGTAAYMSPEQAKGKTVDRRTDIWAFGCVLFEMLTATRPFEDETVSDALAAVIRAEPEWSLPRLYKRGLGCVERKSFWLNFRVDDHPPTMCRRDQFSFDTRS